MDQNASNGPSKGSWRDKLGLGNGKKDMPKIADEFKPTPAEPKPAQKAPGTAPRAPQPVTKLAPMAPRTPGARSMPQSKPTPAPVAAKPAVSMAQDSLAERLKAQRTGSRETSRAACFDGPREGRIARQLIRRATTSRVRYRHPPRRTNPNSRLRKKRSPRRSAKRPPMVPRNSRPAFCAKRHRRRLRRRSTGQRSPRRARRLAVKSRSPGPVAMRAACSRRLARVRSRRWVIVRSIRQASRAR